MVLQPFGVFDVFGQLGGCPANSHIVAVHPALAGLTDASLSNWGCSSHGGFVTWDPAFSVLVITLDLPSPFVASDGTTGLPYFVARGEELIPIACGDGMVMGDEECDDGKQCGPFGSSAYNTACTDDGDCAAVPGSDGCATRDGDGCEANCRFPEVAAECPDLEDAKAGAAVVDPLALKLDSAAGGFDLVL